MTAAHGDVAGTETRTQRLGRAALWFHVGSALVTLLLLAGRDLPGLLVNDVYRYAEIATGPTFWSQQPVEFPPLSALYLWLTTRWAANAPLVVLPAANLVLDVATVGVLHRTWGARAANRYLVMGALLLPLTLFRLDHLSVLLVVLGLAYAKRGLDGRAGIALAAGVLAKLWPAAIVVTVPRRRSRLLITALVAVLVGAGVWASIFGGRALEQVLTFRGAAGWQIESLAGSLLHLVGGRTAHLEAGAWRVGDPPFSASLGLAAAGLVLYLLALRRDEEHRPLAIVLSLVLASPLFSAQFVLWLVPLAAVLPRDPHARRQVALLTFACATTIALAFVYPALTVGDPPAMALLALRNGALVAMLVLSLRRAPAPPTGPEEPLTPLRPGSRRGNSGGA